MTKTLVALVLIAGGILLVTRLIDTDKPVPARHQRTRAKSRKLDACRRLCQPATFAILLIPGRSAPFRSPILWLSIQRSPRKPQP